MASEEACQGISAFLTAGYSPTKEQPVNPKHCKMLWRNYYLDQVLAPKWKHGRGTRCAGDPRPKLGFRPKRIMQPLATGYLYADSEFLTQGNILVNYWWVIMATVADSSQAMFCSEVGLFWNKQCQEAPGAQTMIYKSLTRQGLFSSCICNAGITALLTYLVGLLCKLLKPEMGSSKAEERLLLVVHIHFSGFYWFLYLLLMNRFWWFLCGFINLQNLFD